jgi:phosphatidylserine/phosphatidylglycerophosphate/cardiolipin synthase-like enzyme
LSAHRILQPVRNCWRIERADRFACIQDAADYFRLVRNALLAARQTVFILGWDILPAVDLCPVPPGAPRANRADAGPPTRLDRLLDFIARRRPELRCYILIWDFAAVYALERDPFSRWKLTWAMPRRVRFAFDGQLPLGASHHQKVVVVDDQLAFCGGIDLTGHRWDTPAHRVDEPARMSRGRSYEPYHEIQAMATGPIAAALGLLARDRWRALGEELMPPVDPIADDLWPSDVEPDLTDVDVAIARTIPTMDRQEGVKECEALFLDSIAAARQSIYIESQYFTSDSLGDALASRLGDREGPEIVIVSPKECHGWLEQNTMCAFRNEVFLRLLAADRYRRLRLVHPAASRARNVATFVHSKVMVVDDELMRIGSANFSRRSLGVDTECDVAVEACGNPQVRTGIRRIRHRLLAEHLGLSVEAVEQGIARTGVMRAFIDEQQDADHTLEPIAVPAAIETVSEALRAAADPDEPLLAASPKRPVFDRLAVITAVGLLALTLAMFVRNLSVSVALILVGVAALVRVFVTIRRRGRVIASHLARVQLG